MKLTSKFMYLALVLVLVASMIPAIVSAQDVAREDTVIFDIDGREGPISGYDTLNWMLPGVPRNAGLHQAVTEPLFILNYESGEIQPWLAESMESNEAADVWTLNMRDGAYWSDGEVLDADDMMFTMELLLNDETATLNNAADTQQWVESVEKIDAYTVQFNLLQPNPRFQLDFFSVRIWGGINIMPEHVWADQDPFTFKNYDPEMGYPLGSGPYKLVSASETEYVYDRDDNWWGAATGVFKLPEPLRLIWVVTGNDQIRATLLANAELDSVMDITLGAFEAAKAENPNVIAWNDGMPWVWLDPCPRQMSVNYTTAPWDNPVMRQALSLATDREEIIAIAYEGVTIPSRSMFVEYGGMFPYIEAMVAAGQGISSTADLEAAAALLEGEGYAKNDDGYWALDGEVLGLTIEAHEGFIEKRRVTADLVEQYQRFGIDAAASIVAGATWEDNKAFGNFVGTTDWDACASINEPWASMNRYSNRFLVPIGERAPGGNNFIRWSGEGNDAYSEIVEAIGVLPLGDPAIVDMVVEAMGYWTEAMPTIPLVQATKLIPFDTTYWTGWPTTENNYNHPATWWQSTHQILQNLEKAE
ncbi:ABC transporter substrate-binding protein [Chloroflexota bacterium]